jgi:hypothetical protein
LEVSEPCAWGSVRARHLEGVIEESDRRVADGPVERGALDPGRISGNSSLPISLLSLTRISWSTRPGRTSSSAIGMWRAANPVSSSGIVRGSAAPAMM